MSDDGIADSGLNTGSIDMEASPERHGIEINYSLLKLIVWVFVVAIVIGFCAKVVLVNFA